MFLTLSEWYYHGSGCGYQTKTILVNIDEISEIAETNDPYHNVDGSYIAMKNGNHHNVREDIVTITNLMERVMGNDRI